MKSRGVTIALCGFLGGIGAHKYYLDEPGIGIVYSLFFWTGIPLVISIIDLIVLLCMDKDDFDIKYNS